ncbi:MAG: 1-deoxy-D-xylulose-5-phosphate reductoisomerase, partial [Desulfotomaculaceae bacterium]|nr:1-deoxy-D-xylulose-5-phosphate reductoisomerase [Desulfotomaculaceae bacterium]
MKRIVIFGSTGSIGRQTLEVIRRLPEQFKVVGLAAGKNWRLLSDQIKEFKPVAVALAGEQELKCLKREIASG